MSSTLRQIRRPLVAAAILVVLGLVASTNAFWMLTATSAVVLYILVASFNIVYGYAGLLSLFHTALYGVGAYTAVVLEARLDISFWITLPLAMLAAFVFAMLIALPTARLGGIFLAIATLGAGIGAEEVFLKWQSVTGGVNGFGGIAPPTFFGITLFGGDITYYWLVAVFALLTFEILTRTSESRLGRRFVALRESTLDTQSVGVNPFTVRIIAFGLSGLFAGLAGTLLAHLTLFITATSFSLSRVIEVLIVTMIGGAGTVFGPVVGVIALIGFQELAARVLDLSVVLGIGIVLLNIYAPKGLVGFITSKVRRPKTTAVAVATASSADLAAASPLDTAHGEHRLVVRDVGVVFGGVHALSGIDIDLRSGHVFGLIGPNGAGKTTCVNVISGHVKPTSGTVEMDGESLLGLAPFEVARRGVVRTFQATRLVPSFDLLTNVMMGRDRFGRASLVEQVLHTGRSRRDDEEARLAAMSLLDTLGVAEHALRTAADVPYGIRRRAEIAKALAVDPRFLLLDEPGAGISAYERDEVAAAIKAVAKLNIGILVIDHNIGFVSDVCDEVTVLAAGAVIASGTAEEVLSHKDVVAAYLGEAEVVEA
jgi:branched-chain amino acid transport system permease protein